MRLEPEILFHRFFTSLTNPQERERYRGRLEVGHDGNGPLLNDLRTVFNNGLVAQHGRQEGGQPRFYFDYVDSVIENALAFPYEGIAFIGITQPLIESLIAGCVQLSNSSAVGKILDDTENEEQRELVLSGIMGATLSFVIGHEYGHHRLGHHEASLQEVFHDELPADGGAGTLEQQAREVHADGMGAFLALNHIINGEGRDRILRLLGREPADAAGDELLLKVFILGVANYFFTRRPLPFAPAGLYTRTHPPATARINYVMQNAQRWATDARPAMGPLITQALFERMMAAAEAALWGPEGATDWHRQYEYFMSAEGKRYFDALGVALAQTLREAGDDRT